MSEIAQRIVSFKVEKIDALFSADIIIDDVGTMQATDEAVSLHSVALSSFTSSLFLNR